MGRRPLGRSRREREEDIINVSARNRMGLDRFWLEMSDKWRAILTYLLHGAQYFLRS